ncbi:glycosyltransferase 87 family protein [Streptomyces sp. NBC_01498]|nr:glycosyltransferase 87 family protein [Streptomyces sp. NBC_01498]WTL28937.1 glycosyltransferase 87 family protein [Streptomyces sp. NBC_01498]
MLARVTAGRRSVLLGTVVCLLSFAGFWIAQRLAAVSMIDLMVYRAEGRTVLDGLDLYAMRATYAGLPTTYPPFAALLFTPLTLLPVPEMRTLATAGNLLLLVAFTRLSLRLTFRDSVRPGAALWVAAVAVWCEPVWTTLRYGQINLLIGVAVLWDLTRRDGHRLAGLGIGLAAAVKLTPGLFAVMLLVTGLLRFREAGWNPWLRRTATAAGAFLAATLVSAVILPYDSRRFWTDIVFRADRVGRVEGAANQSLRGVFARVLHTTEPSAWWLPVAAVVVVAGLTVAVRAALRGRTAEATVACAATALLISPVSWSHHWVWCVPMVLLLVAHGRTEWAVATGMGFLSYALWRVPHGAVERLELAQNRSQMTLTALYPAMALGLLAYLAAAGRTERTPAPGARAEEPGGTAEPVVYAVAKE